MMKTYIAKIKSWNRFIIRNLAVAPEVMGLEHKFSFEKTTVTIKIPGLDNVDRGKGFDEVAAVHVRRAADNEPVEYDVYKVDVEVSIPVNHSIPVEVLDRPANAYDLFSVSEQGKLNKIEEQHQSIAVKAYEYWIRIARWVCDDYHIGRDKVEGFSSGWNTYLIDSEDNKKIWIQAHELRLPKYKLLKFEDWQEIQLRLSTTSQPPVYIELKHDAEESLESGDYRRSILNLAMASETFLRLAVIHELPVELNNKLVSFIEDGNISQYISKFFPEVLDETANKRYNKLKSDLFRMFDLRNKLVHMGEDDDIDDKLCRKLLKVTKNLFSLYVD